jgi:sulfur carrier protein ThiS
MAKSKSKKRAKPECDGDDFSIINVRVGTCPGKVENYVLNGDRTVECALKAAGLNADDYQIRVNLEPVESGAELEEGDEVLACPPVQGS